MPGGPCSASRSRRLRAPVAASKSPAIDHSGSAHCTGWWVASPVTSARSPPESISTQTCPGEWPGLGTSLTSSVMAWSSSTRSASPASTIGADGVVEVEGVAPRLRRPVLVLRPAEQVAGVREGRDPAPVGPAGVPAHVVEVEVRAAHHVDLVDRVAGLGQPVGELLGAGEPGHPRDLPVADARVHHDRGASALPPRTCGSRGRWCPPRPRSAAAARRRGVPAPPAWRRAASRPTARDARPRPPW